MTKEELKQYKRSEMRLEQLEEKLERLNSEILSPKRQIITDMPHGGIVPSMEDKINVLIELKKLYNKEWDELINMRLDIERAIATIRDLHGRTIMSYRYIDGLNWWEICGKTHYEWDSVHRLHRLALKDISHYRTQSYIS